MHMTAFGIDETCPKGLASHNNRLHIICEDPGIRSGAIRETEALDPMFLHGNGTLYVLGDDITTNPTYTSKSSLGTHIHSACLYSANNALHIGVKDGGAFHIWSTEGGGTTRVPVTTVIEGMRADYRDGLFCVVGLKDYARFSRVGWSYDEILKEAADKRDMLHSLDDNIHELTDAMVDQILTFIHTRIQYVQFPPEQITNMQSLLVMVANAMRPNMYKNQQPSNDAGHLYAARDVAKLSGNAYSGGSE